MRVKIAIQLTSEYLPGDFFRLLWDRGTGGEMAVLVNKIAAFPGQQLGPVFGQRVFAAGTYSGRAAIANTFANRVYGAGSFAVPMGRVELLNKELTTAGQYCFAIQSYDFLGNAAASEQWKEFAVWVCTAPESPRDLAAADFVKAENRLSFSFTPSRNL